MESELGVVFFGGGGLVVSVVIMRPTVECLLNECAVISCRGLCFSQPIISQRPSGTII